MNNTSLAYARYWHHSLADAELGRGALNESTFDQYQCCPINELHEGKVHASLVNNYFKDEDEKVQTIEVLFHPKVYKQKSSHLKENQHLPYSLTPIFSSALLDRDGYLYPITQATSIARDILEPLDRGTLAIGCLSDLDKHLSKYPILGISYSEDKKDLSSYQAAWENFLTICDQLLLTVANNWQNEDEDFLLIEHWLIVKKQSASGFSREIIALYDHIKQENPESPLFERYSSKEDTPLEPCISASTTFSERLAHASDQYPLAVAQRDALSHLMASKHGDILAVNGPPGTGKTTLLLSVVASLWAKAALEQDQPPVIIAASTNNQAVTNIIQAFGKDFSQGEGDFAGRWLPEITSFGAFFPAPSREKEASLHYQTRAFFDRIEAVEFVESAEKLYIEAAQKAFNRDELTVKMAVDLLHQRLVREVSSLKNIKTTWEKLVEKTTSFKAALKGASFDDIKRQHQECTLINEKTQHLLKQWERYLSQESIFYSLFSWLPVIARRRMLNAKVFLDKLFEEAPSQSLLEWSRVEQVTQALKTDQKAAKHQFEISQKHYEQIHTLKEQKQKAKKNWQTALAPLGKSDEADTLTLEMCDELADTQIRFTIFLLTTHYWEGRWLLAMQDLLPNLNDQKGKTGAKTVKARYHRYMMLTPTIVSTFHALPTSMKVRKYDASSKTRYSDDYLYDFIDLLIVDEAGQVVPEVAGASFTLAKKALVIGDTLQIEPIWAISPPIDIGNLNRVGLLTNKKQNAVYESISQSGKSSASGSVMKIAQFASRYHYDPELPRGLFLYEHRRCYTEIINYCNKLCYHGKLIPKRVDRPLPNTFPPMGYLHIDGLCQKTSQGGRYNQLEAATIITWIAENRSKIEELYQKPLSQCLAIVTPFTRQVALLSSLCKQNNIDVGGKKGITIGTVHSLQGAERSIVIFSPVYSKHAYESFIDQSPSMLNVAVSRAKDSFLVFGDMDVLEMSSPSSPSGLLASFLLKDDENQLHFKQQIRQDLQFIKHLRDAQEHDQFLLDALKNQATNEIHIVSPWINVDRMRETGALQAMCDAVQRKINVHVYSDRKFNYDRKQDDSVLKSAFKILSANGIELIIVNKVHSKLVLMDDHLYCAGSFNWFSASRDPEYANHETSLVYQGHELVNEIQVMKDSLRKKAVRIGFEE